MRTRADLSAARLELRFALARERTLLSSARSLADASRESLESVRSTLDGAIRSLAPQIDCVLVFDREEDVLRCTYANGDRATFFRDARIALSDEQSPVSRALTLDHRYVLDDDVHPIIPTDRAGVAVPLSSGGAGRAVVYASSLSAFSDAEIESVVAAIDQATPAYQLAREREDDRRRATVDGLTGLLTPRSFRSRLGDAVTQARHNRLDRIALLFVDTDHFKSWNDTYGHGSGDLLLRRIASLLQASARTPRDLVARNGGDEFCVVFFETEKSAAIERAHALGAAIAGDDRRDLKPPEIVSNVEISASIGVASFPGDAQSAEGLLEMADAAMYHVKRNGRNGVAFYDVSAALQVYADGGSPERATG